MDTQEQKRIVHELISSVEGGIQATIDAGNVPAEWDGHELRQLVAERFARCTFKMTRTRKTEYNNTVLVNNL